MTEVQEQSALRNYPTQESCIKLEEYKRLKTEYLRDYEITIRFLSVGCVIRIGCREIPFFTNEEGMKALNDYVNNPEASISIWNERFNKE